eukprot:1182448-Prorocentrum_minimum.AAC.12
MYDVRTVISTTPSGCAVVVHTSVSGPTSTTSHAAAPTATMFSSGAAAKPDPRIISAWPPAVLPAAGSAPSKVNGTDTVAGAEAPAAGTVSTTGKSPAGKPAAVQTAWGAADGDGDGGGVGHLGASCHGPGDGKGGGGVGLERGGGDGGDGGGSGGVVLEGAGRRRDHARVQDGPGGPHSHHHLEGRARGGGITIRSPAFRYSQPNVSGSSAVYSLFIPFLFPFIRFVPCLFPVYFPLSGVSAHLERAAVVVAVRRAGDAPHLLRRHRHHLARVPHLARARAEPHTDVPVPVRPGEPRPAHDKQRPPEGGPLQRAGRGHPEGVGDGKGVRGARRAAPEHPHAHREGAGAARGRRAHQRHLARAVGGVSRAAVGDVHDVTGGVYRLDRARAVTEEHPVQTRLAWQKAGAGDGDQVAALWRHQRRLDPRDGRRGRDVVVKRARQQCTQPVHGHLRGERRARRGGGDVRGRYYHLNGARVRARVLKRKARTPPDLQVVRLDCVRARGERYRHRRFDSAIGRPG